MQVNDVVEWYSKFVDTEISSSLVKHMLNVGIVSESDTLIRDVNSFLLSFFGGEPLKKDGRYVVKENRKALIESFKDEPKTNSSKNKQPIRFKLQKMGNNKLTLTKK